jgi:hypothetical protein
VLTVLDIKFGFTKKLGLTDIFSCKLQFNNKKNECGQKQPLAACGKVEKQRAIISLLMTEHFPKR